MCRTLIVLSVMMVFALQQGYSCDACGCSINGGGVGLLSSYKNNFVSLPWSNARFIGVAGHGAGGIDVFSNLELSARYNLASYHSYTDSSFDAKDRMSCQLSYIF